MEIGIRKPKQPFNVTSARDLDILPGIAQREWEGRPAPLTHQEREIRQNALSAPDNPVGSLRPEPKGEH